MEVTISIAGLNSLARNMKMFPEITAPHIRQALRNSLLEVSRMENPPTMPVDTGNLRAKTILAMASPEITLLKAIVTIPVHYAQYVHEGTYKMKARPFITDGFQKARAQVEERFKEALENSNKQIANIL